MLFGGLVNIPDELSLYKSRDYKSYTKDENEAMNIIFDRELGEQYPVGSFTFTLQPNYSDIDTRSVITIGINDFGKLANKIRQLVQKVLTNQNFYFSEFKAGFDKRYNPDDKRYVLRWTLPEVMKGYKILDNNSIITLENALKMRTVIKLDYYGLVDGRYIEVSNFIILRILGPFGNFDYISVPQNYEEIFPFEVYKEMKRLADKNQKDYNLFKALKRAWSLSRYIKNTQVLKKIEPIVNSNLALIAQIKSDLESMSGIIEKEKMKAIPYASMAKALDLIKKKLSKIGDLDLNDEMLYLAIDEIIEQLLKKDKESIVSINVLIEYFKQVLNRETEKALNNIKFNIFSIPLPSQYIPSQMK